MRRYNAKERTPDEHYDERYYEYPYRVFASRPVKVPQREEKIFYGDEPPPRAEIQAGDGVAHFRRAYAGHAARQALLRAQGNEMVFDRAIGDDVIRPAVGRAPTSADAAAVSRANSISDGSSIERTGSPEKAGELAAAAAQPKPVDPAGRGAPAENPDDIFGGDSPESFGYRQ